MSLAACFSVGRSMPRVRPPRALLGLTALLLAGLAPMVASDKPVAATASRADSGQRVASSSYYYHPEVRLRKLHLVRPDLIPYPLAYDVYC